MDYQPYQGGPVPGAPAAPQPVYPPQGYPQQGYAQQGYAQPAAMPQGYPQAALQPVFVPQSMPQPMMPQAVPTQTVYYVPVKDLRVKNGAKAFNRMNLVTLLQFLLAFAVEIPLVSALTMMGKDIYGDGMLLTLLEGAMVPLSTALPFLLVMILSRQPAAEYLKFRKTDKVETLLLVLAGLAVVLAANIPAGWLQDLMNQGGYDPTPQLTEMTTIPQFLAEFAITAILVPIMEEFAFRGVLLTRLERHGEVFALVGSALIFSLAHMDATTVIFAFLAGLVFGFLYMRTRNLWVSICLHALNNGLAVIGSAGDLLFAEQYWDLADALLFYLPIALGVIALVLLLIFKRKALLEPLQSEHLTARPLSLGESVLAYVRAPGFWAMVAMSVVYTVSQFL